MLPVAARFDVWHRPRVVVRAELRPPLDCNNEDDGSEVEHCNTTVVAVAGNSRNGRDRDNTDDDSKDHGDDTEELLLPMEDSNQLVVVDGHYYLYLMNAVVVWKYNGHPVEDQRQWWIQQLRLRVVPAKGRLRRFP